jgi:mitochondrial fission protein ELM1
VRAGDTAQALELARRVGGKVVAHQLTFNWRHHLPNWLSGASAASLEERSRATLMPPWPDLVIATGKRTAPVALWIKQQSKGKTVVVQLGRPRMVFRHFDLIVTTPQYGLPAAENVVRINLPFAAPKAQEKAALDHWRQQWKALPRPLIAAAIGAAKFPLKLGAAEVDAYGSALGALARREGGSILLFGSPRSAAGAVERVRAQTGASTWIGDGSGTGNPYQAALSLADMFAVTGDSVSMASEMVATGKPTHVFPLPSWPSLRWRAESGLTGWLARSGVLVPPRDVGGFIKALLASGAASDLRDLTRTRYPRQLARDQDDVVQRIRSLLGHS